MRTDRQAGFLLDRGFQVFNTSYPQVRRRIDLRALQLRPFTPGMLLHTSRGRVRFTDPTRQPRRAAGTLTGHLAGPRDVAALALLTARDMLGPASRIRHRRDQIHAGRAETRGHLRRADRAAVSAVPGGGVPRRRAGDLEPVFPPDLAEHAARQPVPAAARHPGGSRAAGGGTAAGHDPAGDAGQGTDRRGGAARRRNRAVSRHGGRGDRRGRRRRLAARPTRARHQDRHHRSTTRRRLPRWPSRPCW